MTHDDDGGGNDDGNGDEEDILNHNGLEHVYISRHNLFNASQETPDACIYVYRLIATYIYT